MTQLKIKPKTITESDQAGKRIMTSTGKYFKSYSKCPDGDAQPAYHWWEKDKLKNFINGGTAQCGKPSKYLCNLQLVGFSPRCSINSRIFSKIFCCLAVSVGIFLFKYKPKKIRTHEETIWQISTDPEFKNILYDSTLNDIRENGFKIGDTVVVVISDEKYKGKIVKVKKNNRYRVYISALETTLTFKSSDITLKTKEIK